MGGLCDYCGEQKPIVYCRSDAASLCLSCDRNIHSANAISKRHSRTLVCERCNSEPAFVTCIEERISLCPNCDRIANSGLSRRRQAVKCYTGCPSAAEFSTIWSFLLDCPSAEGSNCNKGTGSLSISDEHNSTQVSATMMEYSEPHYGSETTVWLDRSVPLLDDAGIFVSGGKGPAATADDDFPDDFNMDKVDIDIGNYEEIFGDDPELFYKAGLNGMFDTKESMSATNCGLTCTAEEPSVGASAASAMSCKTEPCLMGQANSTVSFSGDYHDCGASSNLIMADPPQPSKPSSSTQRNNAVMRYKEKRKARKFEKKVRYVSRKARADVRKRVKGRFVKAGDPYDYDPLSQCRSY